MIEPFANNHQSMQIGELVIENQKDKIIIYGDIELYLNENGHEQAKKLHELTNSILKSYENADNFRDSYNKNVEESKLKDDRLDDDIDNPFL
ncbi:hypothetical protein M0N77_10900 [Psychrobacter sp. AH5]|uniref:hypothetical protein n=1 Tax=Psychrobacter sp. AH5 TaxID=2937433 RepID=UPI00333F0CD7